MVVVHRSRVRSNGYLGSVVVVRHSRSIGMTWSRSSNVATATVEPASTTVGFVATSVPRITTRRLVLRCWHDDDRSPFAAMNADAEVMHDLGGPLDRSESDRKLDRYAEAFDSHGYGRWVLEGSANGEEPGFQFTRLQCTLRRVRPLARTRLGWNRSVSVRTSTSLTWLILRSPITDQAGGASGRSVVSTRFCPGGRSGRFDRHLRRSRLIEDR